MLYKTILTKLSDVAMSEEMEKSELYRILVDNAYEGLAETINYKISAIQNCDLSDKEIEEYFNDIISDLEEIKNYLQNEQKRLQELKNENTTN